MTPPKPAARPDRVSLWRYVKLFRQDILSAQPARLYRAKMAEFRTPFFRSYLLNQPELVKTVLKDRPMDFPKSDRIGEGLRPLLGESVFLTNGETWQRQRRIIDPAFEGGRLRETYPAMWDAAQAALARLTARAGQEVEIEEITSHAAADVIFRTLFSIPIEDEIAQEVFHEFRAYQRTQPILNLAAFIPVPGWMPRFFRRDTKAAARRIRGLITRLTEDRQVAIAAGTAPDDLATKIMTTRDPETGQNFSAQEMVDQVAIFFLAGHETSASALGWALYLMATHPEWQEKVAEEAQVLTTCDFADISKLRISRDVFREALRLYPPVPMMVRETTCPERFRDRDIPQGAQMVLSPWHLHRHEGLWDNPDGFDPARWQTENGKRCGREAYMPFSAGPRVCTGAGFAMVEGVLLLSLILRDLRVTPVAGHEPVPEAHLTVRSRDGIWLHVMRR
ncbi:Cytochrome P450 [Mameliella alba]|uniref:cytochrome P450 n=1 Tax=Mameliella alba TaxID=561184 RepID=UPI00088BF4A4|nr:cytochrome P450 [Mameliella alba]OWV50358.1 cytochrome P450 [Mameliella alba]PTR42236.1 cytochrome P450 [Mameliella alba]GGF56209.1 cytochrome P450 [Mameliella alba]SDC03077.1 Cytochrome P450 [Mameliella alba]